MRNRKFTQYRRVAGSLGWGRLMVTVAGGVVGVVLRCDGGIEVWIGEVGCGIGPGDGDGLGGGDVCWRQFTLVEFVPPPDVTASASIE